VTWNVRQLLLPVRFAGQIVFLVAEFTCRSVDLQQHKQDICMLFVCVARGTKASGLLLEEY